MSRLLYTFHVISPFAETQDFIETTILVLISADVGVTVTVPWPSLFGGDVVLKLKG